MSYDAREEVEVLSNGFGFYVNPGTGPVADSQEAEAVKNMVVFVADLEEAYGKHFEVVRNHGADDGEGRYGFTIVVEGERHDIEMPGLPVEQVRYLDRPDQNIWDFPRLYVDGSSWVWKFAVGVLKPE